MSQTSLKRLRMFRRRYYSLADYSGCTNELYGVTSTLNNRTPPILSSQNLNGKCSTSADLPVLKSVVHDPDQIAIVAHCGIEVCDGWAG